MTDSWTQTQCFPHVKFDGRALWLTNQVVAYSRLNLCSVTGAHPCLEFGRTSCQERIPALSLLLLVFPGVKSNKGHRGAIQQEHRGAILLNTISQSSTSIFNKLSPKESFCIYKIVVWQFQSPMQSEIYIHLYVMYTQHTNSEYVRCPKIKVNQKTVKSLSENSAVIPYKYNNTGILRISVLFSSPQRTCF